MASPKWTARFAGVYNFYLSGGSTLAFGAGANYRDSMWLSVDNVLPLSEGDYWLIDGYVSWTSQGGSARIQQGAQGRLGR